MKTIRRVALVIFALAHTCCSGGPRRTATNAKSTTKPEPDRRTRACSAPSRLDAENIGAAQLVDPAEVAGEIADVRVAGNHRLNDAEVLVMAHVQAGQFVTPILVADVTRRLWKSDELDQVSITWIESVLTIEVREAPLVGQVFLPATGVLGDAYVETQFGIHPGDVYRPRKMTPRIAALQALYRKHKLLREDVTIHVAYFGADKRTVDLCVTFR